VDHSSYGGDIILFVPFATFLCQTRAGGLKF